MNDCLVCALRVEWALIGSCAACAPRKLEDIMKTRDRLVELGLVLIVCNACNATDDVAPPPDVLNGTGGTPTGGYVGTGGQLYTNTGGTGTAGGTKGSGGSTTPAKTSTGGFGVAGGTKATGGAKASGGTRSVLPTGGMANTGGRKGRNTT